MYFVYMASDSIKEEEPRMKDFNMKGDGTFYDIIAESGK